MGPACPNLSVCRYAPILHVNDQHALSIVAASATWQGGGQKRNISSLRHRSELAIICAKKWSTTARHSDCRWPYCRPAPHTKTVPCTLWQSVTHAEHAACRWPACPGRPAGRSAARRTRGSSRRGGPAPGCQRCSGGWAEGQEPGSKSNPQIHKIHNIHRNTQQATEHMKSPK